MSKDKYNNEYKVIKNHFNFRKIYNYNDNNKEEQYNQFQKKKIQLMNDKYIQPTWIHPALKSFGTGDKTAVHA